jgi:hypothetical protein
MKKMIAAANYSHHNNLARESKAHSRLKEGTKANSQRVSTLDGIAAVSPAPLSD